MTRCWLSSSLTILTIWPKSTRIALQTSSHQSPLRIPIRPSPKLLRLTAVLRLLQYLLWQQWMCFRNCTIYLMQKQNQCRTYRYKSLKSWKINNIDLTQQFSLTIFTDFRYQSIKITWLLSISIDCLLRVVTDRFDCFVRFRVAVNSRISTTGAEDVTQYFLITRRVWAIVNKIWPNTLSVFENKLTWIAGDFCETFVQPWHRFAFHRKDFGKEPCTEHSGWCPC